LAQRVRAQLETWHDTGLLTEDEKQVLLASLLESMDMVANTASIYGAYLKHIKRSAQQPLTLKAPLLLNGNGAHRVFQEDANVLIKHLAAEGPNDVLYIDPPYNRRQYHSNYHLLETIARWDLGQFTPLGKTGLRPAEKQRSAFALRTSAREAMAELLANADFRHIVVSYSNEGLISEADLMAILDAKSPSGIRDYKKIPYKRFRADNDSSTRNYKGDLVEEFLFYVRVG
jgi:adenine-specific DNA-methyltransferase